jgi:hypothetical protein
MNLFYELIVVAEQLRSRFFILKGRGSAALILTDLFFTETNKTPSKPNKSAEKATGKSPKKNTGTTSSETRKGEQKGTAPATTEVR